MAKKVPSPGVKMAFEQALLRIPLADIEPVRPMSASVKKHQKFAQITASIREIGIIEPLLVARPQAPATKFLLLDGHLRLEALKEIGAEAANCLISTDDEAFTYNKRVNRLAVIQEHKMILRAIDRGVPRERIAKALNLDVATLMEKMKLLSGICPEAVEILKDKHVPVKSFRSLKQMIPLRQIEAAELMVAMNKYSGTYVKSLLAATPQSQLVAVKPKAVKGLTPEQIALMERESANLDREFKNSEESYAADHLDLVLARGYLAKIIGNARVASYLRQHHRDIFTEFQRITNVQALPA